MAVHINLQRRTVTLAVGDLVGDPLQAVGRVGGLGIWARLQIGRDTHSDHQDTQAARHADYGREIVIRHTMAVDDFQVTIQGRIDGVIPPQPPNPTIIEEIKSVVLNPLSFASISSDTYPHYREQLELYCYLASQEKGLSPIHLMNAPL